MKNKKILLILATALVLGACGNEGTKPADDTKEDKPAVEEKVSEDKTSDSDDGVKDVEDDKDEDEKLAIDDEKNVRDFIQIPYTEIKMVTASVIFNKKITRFAIHTKTSGDFIFNSPENKAILRALNKYLPDDKLRRSLTVWDYVKKKFKK